MTSPIVSLRHSLRRSLRRDRRPDVGGPPPNRLWNVPAFRDLWLASTISDFGVYVSALALPLTAVVTLHASPVQMGLLTAVEWLPFVALGLVAGVLVDRLPRAPLLVAADWIRAALLALIPLLFLADQLQFAWLAGVAFGVGTCSLVFQVAQASVMPTLLPSDQLAEANGRIEASAATAQATGPGIAGLLIGAVTAPVAIFVNAISFAVSGLILRRLLTSARDESDRPATVVPAERPARETAGHRLRTAVREIAEGLRVYAAEPTLRASLFASTTINLFGYLFLAVYILFMSRSLGLSELTIGVILSLGGVGAVLGSLVSERLRVRFGFGRTMVWAMLVCCATSLLVPLAFVAPSTAVPVLAACELLQYGTLAIFNIGGRTLRQVLAGDELQGRVNATARTLAGAGTIAGSLAGGFMGSWVGLGPTLVIGAIGMMLAIPVVLRSPLGSIVSLASPPSAPVPTVDGTGTALPSAP